VVTGDDPQLACPATIIISFLATVTFPDRFGANRPSVLCFSGVPDRVEAGLGGKLSRRRIVSGHRDRRPAHIELGYLAPDFPSLGFPA
jgi:hypothetical protein